MSHSRERAAVHGLHTAGVILGAAWCTVGERKRLQQCWAASAPHRHPIIPELEAEIIPSPHYGTKCCTMIN
jgi:hypothetical protein